MSSRVLAALMLLTACDVGSVAGLPDGGSGPAGRYHPAGFAAAEVHGEELRLQRQDCRSCHGADLTGSAAAPSCDTCHAPATPTAWRTDCTFCHGGGDNTTGAPPRNIDGATTPSTRFPAHTAHVASTMSAPMDCKQCHVKAIDVLSPGHVFDGSPGEAENDFGAGLSPQGVFDPQSGCANLFCHGSGRADDGVVAANAGAQSCASCHPGPSSGAVAWGGMSGTHALHLGAGGATCAECHGDVTTNNISIANPLLHVNGFRDVAIGAAGFTFDNASKQCAGSCHGHPHAGQAWEGGDGSYHPTGFAAPEVHGPEMELQRQDCRGCHGANLTGAGSAPSCDGCHTAGWRTNCIGCHGGGFDLTGAPPRDLGALPGSLSASFVAHPKHVSEGVAQAFDCVQCHTKPTNVMSAGHAFDATHEAAEVTFAGGLSPMGTFNGVNTCSNNYCHGNGRVNGSYSDGGGPLSCAGCHPSTTSSPDLWQTMSGEHKKHLELGYGCNECHLSVTTNSLTIAATNLHVNGSKQVQLLVGTIAWAPATKRCTGPCHGENHNDTW